MFEVYRNIFNKNTSSNASNYKYRITAQNTEKDIKYFYYTSNNIWFFIGLYRITKKYKNFIIKFNEIYIEYIDSKLEIKN